MTTHDALPIYLVLSCDTTMGSEDYIKQKLVVSDKDEDKDVDENKDLMKDNSV